MYAHQIALKGNYTGWNFYVAVFDNKIENLIQYNPAIFASDQTAKAEITGIEFNFNTEVFGWLLGLSGSDINPENEASGKLLPRRAEQSLSLDIDRELGNFGFGFSVRSESERFDDAANTTRLGGYTTFAIRVQYQLSEEWALKARVDNATDKGYATAVDFSLGKYRSLGREAFISIVYTPSL